VPSGRRVTCSALRGQETCGDARARRATDPGGGGVDEEDGAGRRRDNQRGVKEKRRFSCVGGRGAGARFPV
jgi:hypothetical protein